MKLRESRYFFHRWNCWGKWSQEKWSRGWGTFIFQLLKRVCLSNRNIGQISLNVYFWFILLFTSSSPCRKDQFAVFYEPLVFFLFPENLKVYKSNYEILTNWEIKVVTSRCHGSKISGKVRRHIGKREDPGDEVEIEVLSAAISRLSLASKRKLGIASFLCLALRFYPLSFPVRRTPKVFEK